MGHKMSKNITMVAKFLIEEGKFEEFKKEIPKVIEFGKTHGCLLSEYYFSDDKTSGLHITRHEDSDKLKNYVTDAIALYADSDSSMAAVSTPAGFELYGGPIGDDVKEIYAAYDPVCFPEEYG